jgi:putative restriction endonuclease
VAARGTSWYARRVQPFLAVTDENWFEYLSSQARDGRVDEVNFWSPTSKRPMKALRPGEPVFFRLKSPHNAIAGYGFFAHHAVLRLDECWRMFGWRNGDPDAVRFLQRIGGYRGVDLVGATLPDHALGCTVLRDAHYWPRSRWIPWGDARGWPRNVVRGLTERDPARAALLLGAVEADATRDGVVAELAGSYRVVTDDERLRRAALVVVREGQGTFRTRLLDAYGRACAVTGEHTEPVLDAAHIQPYLGPSSNNLQNGLLLTKEFHTLFDAGLVAVTPDYRVRVSPALRSRWKNGRRYYAYDGKPLEHVPERAGDRPSRDALDWHLRHRFQSAG